MCIRDSHSHALELKIEPELPEIVADRERVVQVMMNIVSNSIKYTPDGGRIVISAGRRGDRVWMLVDDLSLIHIFFLHFGAGTLIIPFKRAGRRRMGGPAGRVPELSLIHIFHEGGGAVKGHDLHKVLTDADEKGPDHRPWNGACLLYTSTKETPGNAPGGTTAPRAFRLGPAVRFPPAPQCERRGPWTWHRRLARVGDDTRFHRLRCRRWCVQWACTPRGGVAPGLAE